MEFPRGALTVQRVLAALMLAASLGAAAVERGSPLAARVREGGLWPFWLAALEPGEALPAFHLGVYDPARRSLALIRVPEQTRLQGKTALSRVYTDALRATGDSSAAVRAVEDLAQERLSALSLEPVSWEGAGRLRLLAVEEEETGEGAAIRALKARGRSPRALAALAREALRGLRAGDRASADALLLALELRRVPLERLQAAWLPDDAAAPAFLARVFAPRDSAPEDRATVAEVLNGTEREGLAKQASKMLRLKGVDVLTVGAADGPRARTVVYDRTGDFARAARVRDALDCPSAVAATRIDASRAVDASVVLGDDCAQAVKD